MGGFGNLSGSMFATTKGRVFIASAIFVFAAAVFFAHTSLAQAQNGTFSHTTAISVPGANTSGNASPNPSIIGVGGMTGDIEDVNVTLTGVEHPNPDDIDVLLVSPSGQNLRLLSDAGGTNDITDVNLTFDDEAAGSLPDSMQLTTGTYTPTNNGTPDDVFSGSGISEATPFGAAFSVFDGSVPNGNWKLYVVDDSPSHIGRISGGWSIEISTDNDSPEISEATGGTTDEGSPAEISVTASDEQNDPLTYSFDCENNGNFSNDGDTGSQPGNVGECTFDDDGEYSVGVKVSDGKTNGSDTDTATVTVENVAPTATFGNNGPIGEGGEAGISFTNPEDPSTADTNAGFRYEYHCDGSPFTENPDYDGASTTNSASESCEFGQDGNSVVSARIIDKDDSATSYTTTVEVNNVEPTIENVETDATEEEPVAEGSPAEITATVADPGDDTLSYAFDCNNDDDFTDVGDTDSQASNVGQCTFDDEGDGSYTVGVKVGDDDEFVTGVVEVFVENAGPEITLTGDDTANEGQTKTYSFSINDPGVNDTHTITTSCAAAEEIGSRSYDPETRTGSFQCRFLDGGVGKASEVTATVTDNDGDMDEQSITTNIANVAPTISAIDDVSINENAATGDIEFTVADDGADALTVAEASSDTALVPLDGIVIVGTGGSRTVKVTPTADMNGESDITITVSDGDRGETGEEFKVIVRPVNSQPNAGSVTPATVDGDADNKVEINLFDAADDNETSNVDLTYDIEEPTPDQGTLTPKMDGGDPVTGVFIFDPADNYNTGDTTLDLEYKVTDRGDPDGCDPDEDTDPESNLDGCDSAKTSEPGTVSIDINPANDAPIARDDPNANDTGARYTVAEDNSLTVAIGENDILANDTDADNADGGNAGLTVADGSGADGIQPEIGPANGSLTLNENGSFMYAPDENYNGFDSFTYKATDGTDESEAAATVRINVTSVNDAPESVDDTAETGEDTPKVIDVLANDEAGPATAEDEIHETTGQILVVDETHLEENQPANGEVVVNDDGDILYTPDEDYNDEDSPDTFTYKVCDDGSPSECANADVDVTVTPINDAPGFIAEGDEDVSENSKFPDETTQDVRKHTVTGWISAFDPDATGVNEGGADNGSELDQIVEDYLVTDVATPDLFDVEPDVTNEGALTYTLAEDANGASNFTVAVKDSGPDDGNNDDTSEAQTFTIAVKPINAKPEVNDGESEMLEDGGFLEEPLEIDLTELVEPDETSAANMTYDITTDPSVAQGDLQETATNGVYEFDPAPDFNTGDGTDTVDISFTATDLGDPDGCDTTDRNVDPHPQGCADPEMSEEGTVEIRIHPVNDAPEAENDTAETPEDESVIIDARGNDEAGPATAADENAADGEQTLAIDGGHLADNQPANGTATVNDDGNILYAPDEDYSDENSPDTFTYKVCDDGGSVTLGDGTLTPDSKCDEADVAVAVNPVNDAPTLTLADDPNQKVEENSTGANDTEARKHTVEGFASGASGGGAYEDGQNITFEVEVEGGDGDPITDGSHLFTDTGQPEINNEGTLTYTLAEDRNGAASIWVVANDDGEPSAASEPQNFTITVNPVNDAPVAGDAEPGAVNEDAAAVSLDLSTLVNDTETDEEALGELTYEFEGGLSGTLTGSGIAINGNEGTVTVDGSFFTFDPAPNYNTGDTTLDLEYKVTDRGDPDDCDPNDGTDPESNDDGCDSAENDTGAIAIDVDPINDAPSFALPNANTKNQTGNEDSGSKTVADFATNISKGAPNESGQTLEFDVSSDEMTSNGGPLFANGGEPAINPATGDLTYTPADNANGTAAVTVILTDNGLGGESGEPDSSGNANASEAQTFAITVNPVNDTPVANNADRTVGEDGVLGLNVFDDLISGSDSPKIASDIEVDLGETGATLSLTNATQAEHGTVRCNPSGSCTYTPDDDFNGGDSFGYTVRDSNNGQATGRISVAVAPVDDDPIANDDPSEGETLETNRGDALENIDILANDTDPDGDTISIFDFTQSVDGSGDSSGTVAKNPDDTFTFTPNPDFFGTATFTYRVKDFRGTDENADEPNGVSNEATVTISVNDDNEPPDAGGDEYSMNEGTTLIADGMDGNPDGILANDTDEDELFVRDTDPSEPGIQPESGVSHGTLELDGGGTFEYTPNDENFYGTDEFAYIATDRRGNDNLSGETTVEISVENLPDNPVANDDPENDDAYGVNEDGTLTVNAANGILANDTDSDNLTGSPPNEGLAVADKDDSVNGIQPESGPQHGVIAINPNGSFTYAPDANYNGSDSFTYKATDEDGNLSDEAALVDISVSPVADPPSARFDNAATAEDTPTHINVLANDGNPDGGSLAVTVAAEPEHGTAEVIADGADENRIRYTPSPNFHGSDTLTYEICDSGERCDQAQARITVASVNDAPIANPDSYAADDDETLVVEASGLLANDTDADNNGNSNAGLAAADGDDEPGNGISPVAAPSKGTLSLEDDGSFEYTPNADVSGSDTFTYRVSDGDGGFDAAEATIAINVVNKKPTATADEYTAIEDTDLTVATRASGVLGNDEDPDGDPDNLTARLESDVSDGALDLEPDGAFVYTPDENFNGTDSFTYRADDSGSKNNLGVPATVTINVASVNDAPVARPDSASTSEDNPVTIPVLANDTDSDGGDSVSISEFTQPGDGTVTRGLNGTLVFTPAANFNGEATFTYTVTDGETGETATVTVSVSPANDRPISADDSYDTNEDAALAVNAENGVLDNDTDVDDGTTLTATKVSNPSHGNVVFNPNGSFTYTPNAQYNGSDSFMYRAGDGSLSSEVAVVSISVGAVNDKPSVAGESKSTPENTPLVIPATELLANDKPAPASAGDEQSQTLAVTDVGSAENGAVGLSGGQITFTPANNYIGPASFEYTVCDSGTPQSCAVMEATVSVTISVVNSAPVADSINRTMAEDAAPVSINLADHASDDETPDGALDFAITRSPAPEQGTATLDGSNFTFAPKPNYSGTVEMEYSATDDGDRSSAPKTAGATVAITVTPVNDAPTAGNVSANVREDTPMNINVLGQSADLDGDGLMVVIPAQPGKGSATVKNNGTVRYSPRSNLNGPDSFTYKVSDGQSESGPATVSVSIAPVNDSPTAGDDSSRTPMNRAVNINVLANDTDTDSDSLSPTVVRQPAKGRVVRNSNGTLKYTPSRDFVGNVSFTYRASDGKGGRSIATVAVAVTRR